MRDTAWQHGRRVLFGQMYEDAAIEQKAFRPGSRVFCIASAGCTAMALAAVHKVTAVDLNADQLAYAERRALGAPPRPGTAERALQLGRLAVGWRRKTLEEFLAFRDVGQQADYWQARLCTARFQTVFDGALQLAAALFRRLAPRNRALPAHFGQIVRGRLERGFLRHANADNPYVAYVLAGKQPALAARGLIRFVHADAAEFLESMPEGSFDAFSLSNIGDGVTPEYGARLFRAVRRAASPESMVVLRSFLEPENPQAAAFAEEDRALIWGSVSVGKVELLG